MSTATIARGNMTSWWWKQRTWWHFLGHLGASALQKSSGVWFLLGQKWWCDCPEGGCYPRLEPHPGRCGALPAPCGPAAARAWLRFRAAEPQKWLGGELHEGAGECCSPSVAAWGILHISLPPWDLPQHLAVWQPGRAALPWGAASLHRRDMKQAHYWKIVLFNIGNWEVY